MKWTKSVVINTDGASRGNPGPASIGVLITTPKGDEIESLSESIGVHTNNFAEYYAVVAGLKKAVEHKVTEVHLKSDSEFLIKQLKGEYSVKSENILPLYQETKSLLRKFKEVKLEHVTRDKNKKADALANEALDSGKQSIDTGFFKQKQTSFKFVDQAPDIQVVPADEKYIEGFWKVLDHVARQEKYLCMVTAPALEKTKKFVLDILLNKDIQFYALDGSKVVGWADVIFGKTPGYNHVGTLGMGVAEDYRGKGIGSKLLNACIEAAKTLGKEKIELQVLSTNKAAIELYKKFGFVIEGTKKKHRKYKGKYEDHICMGLEL